MHVLAHSVQSRVFHDCGHSIRMAMKQTLQKGIGAEMVISEEMEIASEKVSGIGRIKYRPKNRKHYPSSVTQNSRKVGWKIS